MEADWEVEVGDGAPVIVADWPGFVDLRTAPERANRLMEAGQLPELAEALARLNAAESPVWTSKCDVWPLDTFDADELDAPAESAHEAMGCYIDLLPKGGGQWSKPELVGEWCRNVSACVRDYPLRCCRVDLVVRGALIDMETPGYGVSAYLSAAGPDAAEASRVLSTAVFAFANSVVRIRPADAAAPKLQ